MKISFELLYYLYYGDLNKLEQLFDGTIEKYPKLALVDEINQLNPNLERIEIEILEKTSEISKIYEQYIKEKHSDFVPTDCVNNTYEKFIKIREEIMNLLMKFFILTQMLKQESE